MDILNFATNSEVLDERIIDNALIDNVGPVLPAIRKFRRNLGSLFPYCLRYDYLERIGEKAAGAELMIFAMFPRQWCVGCRMATMRKAILVAAVVGLSARCILGQDHRLRVESARIGPDHRVYLRWTGLPEQVQAPGEEQADTEDLKIAPDRSAAAWLVGRMDLSDASYPEAFELLVAWNGGRVQSIFPNRVISEWHFVDGGRRVAAWDKRGHGGRFGKATLYDSHTRKLLAEWNPDSKKGPPAWAAPFHAEWENDSQ
jgi:hypothetical protein